MGSSMVGSLKALLPGLLVATACASPIPVCPLAMADEPRSVKELELPFPEVAGWKNTKLRPIKETGDGYTVGYDLDNPRVAVTIYVYTRGEARIPSELRDPLVQRVFTATKDGLHQAKQLGIYDDVVELQSLETTLGARRPEPRRCLHGFA